MAVDPVELLRTLIRVPSVNPPGDEGQVAAIVEGYLSAAGVGTEVLTSPGGRASLVARVPGPTDRPALVLLSHSDVVPVEEEGWARDPFGADVADGCVWGRGALDMKGMAVMHAAAVADLARIRTVPTREVVFVMVADEESGGDEGARWLLDEHADLVGFGDGRPAPEVIGEGAYGITGMLDRPVIPVAVGEKTAVWVDLVAQGDPGHGALPPRRQAAVELAGIVTAVAGFGTPRVHPVLREQVAALAEVTAGAPGAVFRALASPAGPAVARAVAPRLRQAGALGLLLSDTVTPTVLHAGHKANVVPGQARASFDCRLLPDTPVDAFVASLDATARRHGGRVADVVQKGHGPVSPKGPLFSSLVNASRRLAADAVATASLSPGITDLRFFRAGGAAAYGWCPLLLTPELLATIHGHDERVPVDAFTQAVAVTTDMVREACR